MSDFQERVPPQAPQIEESVLGAMMMESEALSLALDRLSDKEFHVPANKLIFNVIEYLNQTEGATIDVLSVEEEIRSRQQMERIGGQGYIAELTRRVSSAANIEYHCQILIEKSIKRQIILSNVDIISDAYNSESDVYSILDEMKKRQQMIESRSFLEVPKSISEKASHVLVDITEERNVKDGMVGLPAYLPIDRLTAGFPDKEVCYIAARPSMGKTGYMLTIIKNLIENGFNKPILIFSYEMDRDILILRLLCMMAKVNMQFARRGKLDDGEKIKLTKAASRLGVIAKWDNNKQKLDIESIEESVLFIEDDNMTDIDRMEAKARRIKTEHGLGMVAVDYLQLVPVTNPKNMNIGTREQEVAYISRSMKNQAKMFEVPYVVLSQLSRAVESRKGDNRPILSDLRESGSIEQDATMVLFLYRPEYYNIKRTDSGVTTSGLCEVIVAKNRNGPLGTEKHYFIKQYALFEEWDEENAAMRSGSKDPAGDGWSSEPDMFIEDESPF